MIDWEKIQKAVPRSLDNSDLFTDAEKKALAAFAQAHREFVRANFKEAERLFLELIDTHSQVGEVVSRARFYLEKIAPCSSEPNAPKSKPKKPNAPSTLVDHMRVKNPYEVLGIDLSASESEIAAAFKKLAQMYHPDKVAGLAPEYLEIAKQRMVEINVAYDTLRRKR